MTPKKPFTGYELYKIILAENIISSAINKLIDCKHDECVEVLVTLTCHVFEIHHPAAHSLTVTNLTLDQRSGCVMFYQRLECQLVLKGFTI